MNTVLKRVPDVPRWVEARAMLLAGCGRVFERGDELLIRNERPGGQLIVAVTPPSVELLDRALEGRSRSEVLCAAEDEDVLRSRLPGWPSERAVLFGLTAFDALVPPDPGVRVLGHEDSLDHLEPGLRAEMERARLEGTVFATFDGGSSATDTSEARRAVSFAYAYWKTEGLFDISIDTVASHRRRGLARRAVSELIRYERSAGRSPVWGAMASNRASQQLARGLRFEPVDELAVFTSPNG